MLAGRDYFASQMARLGDDELARPLKLPGWTGKHLLAHLAGNARALGRLADWARTGTPNPMYAGSDERAREIEATAGLDASVLRAAVFRDQHRLEDTLNRP